MNSSGPEQEGTITSRLQAATSELQELGELVQSGDLDARVAERVSKRGGSHSWDGVGRAAVGGTRKSPGDPYAVLPKLSAERVRRATQLTNDLVLDLQSGDVGVETQEGLAQLFSAVDHLHRRLGLLLGLR